MTKVNDNYLKLPGSYLFSTIGKKVAAYSAEHPEKEIIRLGIGDVTQPLAPAVIKALHSAVDEMGQAETFRGYAPIWAMSFCAMPLQKMTIRLGAQISQRMKFLSVTEPSVIPETFRRFSAWIIRLLSVIPCIQCMWIPM